MLYVQIPRLHISVVEVMVHRLRSKARETCHIDCIVETNTAGEVERDCQGWISAGWRHHASHRLVDIDSICSAQHCLIPAKGTPRKANARLKVLVVLVINSVDS